MKLDPGLHIDGAEDHLEDIRNGEVVSSLGRRIVVQFGDTRAILTRVSRYRLRVESLLSVAPNPKLTPGDAVRIGRELQGMTQAELGFETGLSQPTISAIETGRVKLTEDFAERIAWALQVHPNVLLGGS